MAQATISIQTDTRSFNLTGAITEADALSLTQQIANLLTVQEAATVAPPA